MGVQFLLEGFVLGAVAIGVALGMYLRVGELMGIESQGIVLPQSVVSTWLALRSAHSLRSRECMADNAHLQRSPSGPRAASRR